MTAAVQIKRCMKCGKDLTGIKRLKDAKGNYWCPDCGVSDTPTTGSSGLMTTCPVCHKPVHTAELVRNKKTGAYICESCASGVKVKGGGGASGPVDEEAAKRQKMIIVAVCLIVAGGVLYYVMNNYIL